MPYDVTHMLKAAASGDRAAAEQLLPLVYDELRRLAARKMSEEKPGQTLNATALVHEAYLRLVGSADGEEKKWDGRGHFFAAAAEAMRRILVEKARQKSRVKHGGQLQRVPLEEDAVVSTPTDEVILALDEALTRFAVEESDAAKVVELRYFAGFSIDEAADALGVSRATANRHWAYAKAWLRCELDRNDDVGIR
jgi:RNA polymerase sigma factor (TIGR02999 family)